jgi:enamine deaminase RidA (YjgF/YER057c/UK114 family)
MNDARKGSGTRSQQVYPIGKKNPNLPFHPAVRAGDYIFVSGQVAKDADGNMISGTIEVETRGTIEAIARILAEGAPVSPMLYGLRPIWKMPGTSVATTGYLASISRTRCSPVQPSKLVR